MAKAYRCRACHTDKSEEHFAADSPKDAFDKAMAAKGESRTIQSVWLEDGGYARLLWIENSYQTDVPPGKVLEEIFPFLPR